MVNSLLSRLLEVTTWIILTVIIVVVFLQVVFRYVLLAPISWTEELARYLFVWFGFLGAAMAAFRGSHFAFDMFVAVFPRRVREGLSIAINSTVSILMLVIVRQSLTVLPVLNDQESAVMGIPMSWAHASILVSSLLMSVGFAAQAYLSAKALSESRRASQTQEGA